MIRKVKGFTLIEVLVVVMITGVVTFMAYSVFSQAWRAYETGLTYIILQRDSDRIFSAMQEDIMEAEDAVVSGSGGHLQLNYPPSLGVVDDQVHYNILSGNRLTRQEGATGGTFTMSTHIDDASSHFSGGGSQSVLCNLTFIRPVFNKEIKYQLNKTVFLRN